MTFRTQGGSWQLEEKVRGQGHRRLEREESGKEGEEVPERGLRTPGRKPVS